jgi:diguanylate cyclase (GGDEF)-like protein
MRPSQLDRGASWRRRYNRLLRWCVPPGLAGAPQAQLSRIENLFNAAVMAALACPAYALAYALAGFRAGAVAVLACGAAMTLAPLVLRLTGNIKIARELFVVAQFINVTWLTWQLGGLAAPTACWLISPPMIAMFLAGVRSALRWLGFSSASMIAFYLLQSDGAAPPRLAGAALPPLYFICEIGLLLMLVMFVLIFELTKLRGFAKLEEALNTINELATRDDLTGVHNRRSLLGLMEHERQRAQRYGGVFSVCMFDIDFFKRINDTHGHAAGDAVLRAFCRMARQHIRVNDTFGRYGGEEFILMLPETPLDEAVLLAERLRCATAALQCDAGAPAAAITLTVSVGVAAFLPGDAVAQTIARADAALYLAKSAGRDRVVCDASAPPPESRHLA